MSNMVEWTFQHWPAVVLVAALVYPETRRIVGWLLVLALGAFIWWSAQQISGNAEQSDRAKNRREILHNTTEDR